MSHLKKPALFILAVVAIVLVANFALTSKNNVPTISKINLKAHPEGLKKVQYVELAGKKIKVDLATTLETQERGLSGRPSLREDEGMLFAFEDDSPHLFWMKDMNFSIDMIWIDENAKVIYIKKSATPESYPEAFGPEQNSRYVLEVVSGFSDKNNLKEGDEVVFTF